MNPQLRSAFHYYVSLLALCGLLCGMVLSRVLLSVSMIVLVVNAILSPQRNEYFRSFFSYKVLWLPALVFIQVLIAWINSNDLKSATEALLMKLPFLFLPFGFASLVRAKRQDLILVLHVFVTVVCLSTVYVLINYLFGKEEVHYWRGDVMNTPFSHIRYSLIVCMSIFTALYLYVNDSSVRRYAAMICGIWMLIFLHLLAVRSGLLAFYLSAFFLALYYVVKQRKWIEGVSFMAGMIIVPVLAFWYVPTFRQKLHYVSYDLKQFFTTGDAANLSDGQRLFSWKMGLEVFKENWLIGVGAGDLMHEMNIKYEHHQNIEASKRLPHNQWLWTAVSGGVIGLILLATALLWPVWLLRKKWNWYFAVFLLVLHSSMLSEATLESQIGVALYLNFYLLSVILILHPDGD